MDHMIYFTNDDLLPTMLDSRGETLSHLHMFKILGSINQSTIFCTMAQSDEQLFTFGYSMRNGQEKEENP